MNQKNQSSPAPKILVLDDEADVCELFKYEFELYGFAVLTAHEMQEGLRLVQEEKPDLILLDVRLQGTGDGLSFLRKLRSLTVDQESVQRFFRTIPVLIFTADRWSLKGLFDLEQISGYVDKPFDSHELRERLVQIVTRRKDELRQILSEN